MGSDYLNRKDAEEKKFVMLKGGLISPTTKKERRPPL